MGKICDLVETECCGIRELTPIMDCNEAREAIVDAAEDWFDKDKDGAFIFFSATSDSRMGHEVAAYIEKYNLGVVQKTHAMRNPNSDNMLTMWCWAVNKRNFKSYWHKTNRYTKNYKENY